VLLVPRQIHHRHPAPAQLPVDGVAVADGDGLEDGSPPRSGSAESYDGTRREARLPELTGGQLQAFVAVGRSGAPHKQAWRTLEAYRDRDRDTARAPEVEPQPADF